MKFEYVASGTAHTRILAVATLEQPQVLDVIKSYYRHLDGLNGHRFSLLYNAFTESDFGPKFKEFYRDALYTIHADSGGLQIITQGKSITEELKDGVYRNQARNADIAMCFDEIPLGIVGERSGRNSTDDRFFERSKLEEYARRTGKNIKRQIELFLDEKTTSKPMIIAQGNDYETYMLWTEYLLKEIPSSYYKCIGGIALGAAALGTGIMEDIERAAYAPHLPFQMEEPYFHVLGVGSLRRLLPYITLMRTGYYPKNTHLSYDSTTHTSGISIGLYYLNGGYPIDRNYSNPNGFFNQIYVDLYADLNRQFDYAGKGIDIKLYHKMLNSDSSFYHDRKNKFVDIDKMKLYYHAHTGFYSGAIANFTSDVKKCLDSNVFLMNTAIKNKVQKEISSLSVWKCNTLEAFLEWKDRHGNLTKRSRIQASEPASLGDYFD